MARLTDPEKLERIKYATMELVNRNGYQGITTAKIAENARVSAGYLYHHYESKDQLICSLIEDCHVNAKIGIAKLIEENAPFKEMVHHVYHVLLSIANTDPIRAEFIYVLIHDPHFRDFAIANSLFDIVGVLETLRDHALEKGLIAADTTLAEMMVFLIDMPTSYMYYRIKNGGKSLVITEQEIQRIAEKCTLAMQ